MSLQTHFKEFNDTIKLDYDIKSELKEKRDILLGVLRDAEEIPSFTEYNQGSYSMYLGVELLDKEYDIDVGLRFHVNCSDYEPMDLKDKIYELLKNHTEYGATIKKPCVTVTYKKDGEAAYHVDLVVYTYDDKDDKESQLFLARGKKSDSDETYWEKSDPVGLVNYVNDKYKGDDSKEDREQFRRIVRYLKRWKNKRFSSCGNAEPPSIGITLIAVYLKEIRKINKACIFNKGDAYKNYPYFWYWICAKILGYSECNLILVPVYMQFKLVINDTFEKYYCGNLNRKENDVVSVNHINFLNVSDEVNLMISDTYPLNFNQIPVSKRSKPTILVSRDNITDCNRYDSPELVKTIVNEVRNLPQHFRKINIYASTNPQNTMKIVQDAFKVGERGNLDLVTVFPQKGEADNWEFEQKGRIVYKR